MLPILSVSASLLNPNLPFTKKKNLQVKIGSRSMANLYDLLRQHSLTNNDTCLRSCYAISLPDFLRKFLTILPTKILITSQSDQLIHLFPHFIPKIQLIVPKYFYVILFSLCHTKIFTTKTGHDNIKGPPAENDQQPRRRARRPYNSRNPTDAASSSNCSVLPVIIQAGNIRSHCPRLKLINSL